MELENIIFGLLLIYLFYKFFSKNKVTYNDEIQNIINNKEYQIKGRYEE